MSEGKPTRLDKIERTLESVAKFGVLLAGEPEDVERVNANPIPEGFKMARPLLAKGLDFVCDKWAEAVEAAKQRQEEQPQDIDWMEVARAISAHRRPSPPNLVESKWLTSTDVIVALMVNRMLEKPFNAAHAVPLPDD